MSPDLCESALPIKRCLFAKHCGQRKIFVGIEEAHGSRILIISNMFIYFLPMATVVSPGIGQVFHIQRGISRQEIRFACAKLSCLDKHPNRYSLIMKGSPPQTTGWPSLTWEALIFQEQNGARKDLVGLTKRPFAFPDECDPVVEANSHCIPDRLGNRYLTLLNFF